MLDSGGHFDLSFGPGGGQPDLGVVSIAGPVENSDDPNGTQAIAVQGNGDIVEAGLLVLPGAAAFTTIDTAGVIRLLPDGTKDTSFAFFAGTIPGQTVSFVPGIAIQSNGKIDVLGDSDLTTTNPNFSETVTTEAVVFQLDANGQIDTTFGPDKTGYVAFKFGDATNTLPAGIALQANGQIVVAGTAEAPDEGSAGAEFGVTRLNTDGSVDTSFGTGGQVVSYFAQGATQPTGDNSSVRSLALQADGKILVGGSDPQYAMGNPSQFALARLNPDGSFDASFATNGKLILKGDTTGINSLAVASNGNIIVGTDETSTSAYPPLLRLNPAGLVDPTFNASAISESVTYLAIQPDGKVVAVEQASPDSYSPQGLVRVSTQGAVDVSFGKLNRFGGSLNLESFNGFSDSIVSSLAVQANGKIDVGEYGSAFTVVQVLAAATPGDYSGDGQADPTIYLPSLGSFAIRPSTGGPDQIIPFGIAGAGNSIPTPGDYDVSGKTEIAVYLPALGAFAYRPAAGGPDQIVSFGIAGVGQTIPAQGDYEGTGQTDLAVYLPSIASFAVRPSTGGPDQITPFGIAGAGNSIPVPGDYDDSGKTELAVYLPSIGVWAYRPASGGSDVLTQFGVPGQGNSIPVPGDYDGSGKTELAVYLPARAELIYRPANGGNDVTVKFGLPGAGGTIPAPADYEGDGVTDFGGFLPADGVFAYQRTSGTAAGSYFFEQFGIVGSGQSLPVTSLSGSLETTPSTLSAASADEIPLTLDDLGPAAPTRKSGSLT